METEEDIRNVIKFGEALVITLPAKYVRSHKIKAGDKVYVVYNEFLHLKPLRREEIGKRAEKVKEILEKVMI